MATHGWRYMFEFDLQKTSKRNIAKVIQEVPKCQSVSPREAKNTGKFTKAVGHVARKNKKVKENEQTIFDLER